MDTFLQISRLSGVALSPAQIKTEVLEAPHRRPSGLLPGWQVVYAFLASDHCLKVGKAGPRTVARFTSQHDHPGRAPSTLAKSILLNKERVKPLIDPASRGKLDRLTESSVGSWIEARTTRYHFFLDQTVGALALGLLESFLQCRLMPLFEGKSE